MKMPFRRPLLASILAGVLAGSPAARGLPGTLGPETICLPRTFYIVMHPESRVMRTMFHL